MYPDLTADFTATEVICEPAPIEFTNLSTTPRKPEDRQPELGLRRWLRTRYPNSFVSLLPATGRLPVRLTITDENGCSDETTQNIAYFPAPRTLLVEPQEGFGCAPYDNQFINLSVPIDDTYQFDWEFG